MCTNSNVGDQQIINKFYVSTFNGTDVSTCGKEETPCKTIRFVLLIIQQNNVNSTVNIITQVFLFPGLYNGENNTEIQLIELKNISFVALDTDSITAVLDFTDNNRNSSYSLQIMNSSSISFDNILFINCSFSISDSSLFFSNSLFNGDTKFEIQNSNLNFTNFTLNNSNNYFDIADNSSLTFYSSLLENSFIFVYSVTSVLLFINVEMKNISLDYYAVLNSNSSLQFIQSTITNCR